MKRLTAVVLTAILLLGILPLGIFAADGDFSYRISEESATVTAYNGAASDVVIPETLGGHPVTALADGAFRNHEEIRSVTVPDTLITVGREVFIGCNALQTFKVGEDNAAFAVSDGTLYNKDFTTLYCCPAASIGTFSAAHGTAVVADGAFYGCNALSVIRLRYGATSIGNDAFYGCALLTSFTVPDSVTRIGDRAFYGCAGLVTVTIGRNVSAIGAEAFGLCTSLRIINGRQGSYAQTYAGENHYSFALSCSHVYVKGKTTAPTCTERGYTSYVCGICGDWYRSDFTPITAHTYVAVTDEVSASCTENGMTARYRCSGCDRVIEAETIPPLGHAYSRVITMPTCTKGGYTVYTCIRCRDSYRADETEPTGHTLVITPATAPTCTASGLTEGCHCTECDYCVEQEIVPPTGHHFVVTVVPPSAIGQGYTSYACSDCSYHYATDYTHKLEDVASGSYYYDAVRWAYQESITTGIREGYFAPELPCTRAQVVTFLWRTMGCPEPEITESPFADADSDAYYGKAMLWAYENGITLGTSPITFSPDTEVTRAQFVTFLWRCDGMKNPLSDNPFDDVTDTGAYYYKAVLWAVENGITVGTNATAFSPEMTCTRAQIVTFLYRYQNP